MRRRNIWLAALVLTACNRGFNPDPYPTPEELTAAAIEAARRGQCTGTMEAFRRVMFELPPRDPRIAEVRFYLGECHARLGEHLEASRQFRRVADDYPGHDLAPRALMQSGDELSELWRRPELDPTYGEQAMTTYQEVLNRYPAHEIAAQTRDRIRELNNWFAEKAFKTGEFYQRLRAFDSAIIYYENVVAQYPQSEYVARSLVKLAEVYERIGYREERTEACETLRRFYPETEGISDACPVG